MKSSEKQLSPSVLTIVKSYTTCKTENLHSYNSTNGTNGTLSISTVKILRHVTSKYKLTPSLNDFVFNILKFKI